MSLSHPSLPDHHNTTPPRLRERLLQHEWDNTVRPWTRRKGVADFERFAAEKEIPVPFDAVTRLYAVRGGFLCDNMVCAPGALRLKKRPPCPLMR